MTNETTFSKSTDDLLVVEETETIVKKRQYTKSEIDSIIALKQEELAYFQNLKTKTLDLATK